MSLETINFEHFALKPQDRLLDLGCGEGRHSISAYISENVQVVGLDLSIEDMTTARTRLEDFTGEGNINFTCGSGLQLPFADNSFDKVICSEVLEHIPDYQQVLNEIDRVLKPDGLFSLSVPRYFPEWVCWQLSHAYHEVPGGHIRIFRSGELQQAVESHSFTLYKRHYTHGLHSPYWWLRCLFWNAGENQFLVKAYHRLLVWDLMKKPRITKWLELALNPFIGKSVVMYFNR